MRKTTVLILVLLWAPVFLITSSLHAQTPLPFDELGAGPRATAMGQAFTAIADDTSAAYYNPAGLVQIRSPAYVTLGYQYAKPRVKVKFDVEPAQNPYLGRGEFNQSEDFSSRGIYVGFVSNFEDVPAFNESPVSSRFAIGISLFSNLPEINQFDNPQRPQDPYVFKYNERWSLISLAVSFGLRCTDWLSVGGGVLPRVDALQDSRDSWIILNAGADDVARGFRMNLSQTSRINLVPIGGILIRPPIKAVRDKVSIGVCYRGKMWGFYGTGPTAVDVLIRNTGNDPIVIYSDPGGRTVDYIGFNPEQVSCGIAYKPVQGLTLAFDATWKRFSAFHFFWDVPPFDIDPVTGTRMDAPFDDIWVWRGGVEYAFDPGLTGKYIEKIEKVAFRAGYYREDTPVPYRTNGHPVGNMSGPMNILDADQNVVSGGFGVSYNAEWTGRVELEAFFQAHLLENNYILNDRDPLFSGIKVGGRVYNAGIALSIIY